MCDFRILFYFLVFDATCPPKTKSHKYIDVLRFKNALHFQHVVGELLLRIFGGNPLLLWR